MGEKLLSNYLKLKFKGKWRNYQQRVLIELDNYLDDKKLNVVAAPGAGKTTLGIEVVSRLNKPTLILTPTITIKNQWKNRICDSFIENKQEEQYISTNGNDIKPITILTYQLLHSILKKDVTKNQFLDALINNNISTIVLDEAHHLRTEWYKSLSEICVLLDSNNLTTVALTGTPPYDVSEYEWQNYHSLCGPVDAEISIPELVKQGDLCKHQDLIYFSKLDVTEQAIIEDFNKNRQIFFKFLKTSSDFSYSIKTSAFISEIDNNFEIIYEDTDFIVSIISFLLFCDDLDTTALTLLNFLELIREQIPVFDYQQANNLINGIIGKYEKYFKNIPSFKGYLKELNLLDSSKKADLLGLQNQKKIFSKSTSKIQSIKEISNIEYKNLGDNLREVVLLDFVGKNNRSGVNILSTFDVLKNNAYSVAILTGTLIVIPSKIKEYIKYLLEKNGIDVKNVLMTDFEDNYLRVETYGNIDIVSTITELFNRGKINILIGTQALLGEGWDSPAVNTLIIASIVGSFMLSNQMRGRAIRVDKKNLNKISNVWHLVTIDEEEFQDFDAIKRRFNTFEGISFIDNTIQNKIDRLGINEKDVIDVNINKLNSIQIERAISRNKIVDKWTQIFEESALTEKSLVKSFISKYLLNELDTTPILNVFDVIQFDKLDIPDYLIKYRDNYFIKNVFLPIYINKEYQRKFYKKQLFIENLIKFLYSIDLIKTNPSNIKIKNIVTDDFLPYLTILYCTNYERKLIFEVLTEMFSCPNNQRYLLKFEDMYITVPDCIGTHQKKVKEFRSFIVNNLDMRFDIIYTKKEVGKRILLKAKYSKNYIDKTIKTARLWI